MKQVQNNQTGNETIVANKTVKADFVIMNAKRETLTFIDSNEAKNPLTMIGKLCNDFACKVLFFIDFPRNQRVAVIPAAGTYGAKERAIMAHKNFLEAITADLERADSITNKATLETLKLYTAKGWKFTTFTKVGILAVAGEKLKEVTSTVNLVKQITMKCPEFVALVEQNQLRKEVADVIKKDGLEAGLKVAKEKSLKGLPAINR